MAMNDMTPPVVDGAPLEFNPLDPAFIADPYPFYRRLRETAPVFKTPQGFWLITRYEDVAFALRDKRFGKDFVGNMKRRYGGADGMNEPAIASLARTMLVQDPPDHTRLRGLVTKAFTARRVADMRPRIRKIVDEQLDRVAGKGEMDVMRDLAHRLPVIVICDMLGIPEDHRAPFLAGSNVNGRILEPVPMTREEIDQANFNTQAAGVYFRQLCDLRRREPQDDLTTELVRAEEAGDKLTAEELEANIGLLFGAGHETTTNLIGNGLLALHRQPDQWERLKADPSLIPNAIDELLRYDSSVQLTGRVTNTEVEVGGVKLAEHESIVALLGAANRDPAQYPDPDRLDVGREHIRPMSFGGGIHHCLGAQLARLEAELVFAALIERMPNLTLPEKDTPAWRRSFTLRGLSRLPAAWH
jgi:cytochrome P450